jgi:hypothetical protein
MKIEKKSKARPVKIKKTNDKQKSTGNTTISLKFIEQYPFLIFFGLLLFIGIFIFRDFLFFHKLYLFKDIGSDSINTFYPTYVLRAETFKEGLSYTFRNGMGASTLWGDTPFITILVRFLTNPFNTILKYLDKDSIAYAIGWIEFAKIMLTGIIFYFYLRTLDMSMYVSIMGGLFFGFSGFLIGGSGWYQHSFQILYFALLLFGFEQALIKKRYLVFLIILVFAFKSLNIFYLYLFGTFLIIYAIIRLIEHKESFKEALIFIGISMSLVTIAILINLPAIKLNFETIINQPRVSGNLSKVDEMQRISVFTLGDFLHNVTAVLRMFSNDILGTGRINEVVNNGSRALIFDYKGYRNYYEAPMFYIGLLSLLIFPQILYSGTKKQRFIYGIFFILWIIPVIFPYFRRAYFLFFGDYYRVFSIFLPFAILFLALKSLDKLVQNEKLNIYLLCGNFILLMLLLHYPYFNQKTLAELNLRENPINGKIQSVVTIFLSAYFIFLFLIRYKKNLRTVFLLLIMLISVFELIYLSNITVNHRDQVTAREFELKLGYNDYTIDAVAYLKEKDTSFYRIEKDFSSGMAIHSSLNDAEVQGYFGTKSYNSEQEPNYLRFLQKTQVIPKGDETAARWSVGLRQRPLLMVFANIKYMFTKSEKPNFSQFGYSFLNKTGDVNIFKNDYYLPLGYTYNKYIKESVFESLPVLQKDIALLNAVVVEDSMAYRFKQLAEYSVKDTIPGYSIERLKSETEKLKTDSFTISSFKEDNFNGKILIDKTKVLFFSILYDKNWKLKINGIDFPTQIVNCGFTGILLNKGEYNVEMKYIRERDSLIYTFANWIFIILAFGIVVFLIYTANQKKD